MLAISSAATHIAQAVRHTCKSVQASSQYVWPHDDLLLKSKLHV